MLHGFSLKNIEYMPLMLVCLLFILHLFRNGFCSHYFTANGIPNQILLYFTLCLCNIIISGKLLRSNLPCLSLINTIFCYSVILFFCNFVTFLFELDISVFTFSAHCLIDGTFFVSVELWADWLTMVLLWPCATGFVQLNAWCKNRH